MFPFSSLELAVFPDYRFVGRKALFENVVAYFVAHRTENYIKA